MGACLRIPLHSGALDGDYPQEIGKGRLDMAGLLALLDYPYSHPPLKEVIETWGSTLALRSGPSPST
jgi:hypothetical protein